MEVDSFSLRSPEIEQVSLIPLVGPLVDLVNLTEGIRLRPRQELPLEARLVRLVDRLHGEATCAAGGQEVANQEFQGGHWALLGRGWLDRYSEFLQLS